MSSLSHHGIKGQRWGVRRFQNKDGTRTALGRKRQAAAQNVYKNQAANMLSEFKKNVKAKGVYGYEKTENEFLKHIENSALVERHNAYVDILNNENEEFAREALKNYYDLSEIHSEMNKMITDRRKTVHSKALDDNNNLLRSNIDSFYKEMTDDQRRKIDDLEELTSIQTMEKKEAPTRKAKHTSIGGTMYIEGNTLILGDSSYLEHHGIRGQRWGVRRFQNRDGSLTNAGRKRLGYATKGAVQTVGKAFKAGVKAGGNAVKAVKAHHEKKEAEKLQKKKEKASKTRLGVMANKDLFTNEEIRKLNERFKLEDEMKMATLQKGVEIAKAVGTIAQNVGTVAKTYEDVTGQSLSPIKRKAAEEKARQDKEDRERRIAREDAEEARKAAKEERDIAIHEQTLRKAIAAADTQEFTAQKTKAEADSSVLDAIKKGQDFNGGSDATGKSWMEKATAGGKNPFFEEKLKNDPELAAAKAAHDAKAEWKQHEQERDARIAAREKESAAKQSQPQAQQKQGGGDDDALFSQKGSLPIDKDRYRNNRAMEKAKQVKEDAAEERAKKQDEKAAKATIDDMMEAKRQFTDSARANSNGAFDRETAANYIKGKAKELPSKLNPINAIAKKITNKALKEEEDNARKAMEDEYKKTSRLQGRDEANYTMYYNRVNALQAQGYSERQAKKVADTDSPFSSKRNRRFEYNEKVGEIETTHRKNAKEINKANKELTDYYYKLINGPGYDPGTPKREALDRKYAQKRGELERLEKDNNDMLDKEKKKAKKILEHSFLIQNGVLFVDSSDGFAHHGIRGQRWGVRRFQNPDGTLTPAGKKRDARRLQKELNSNDKKWAWESRYASDRKKDYETLDKWANKARSKGKTDKAEKYEKERDQVAKKREEHIKNAHALYDKNVELMKEVSRKGYSGSAKATQRSVNTGAEIVGMIALNTLAAAAGSPVLVTRRKYVNGTKFKVKYNENSSATHYAIENGTLFINAGEPYLEHHGVKGMKWGKHLMAGKGVDAEGGGGGGFAEDDEKLKEMAKKAGMSVVEYRTKMAGKLSGAASKVGSAVYDAAGGSHKKNAEGWRKMAREESNAARASEKSSHENSAKAASQDRKYGSGGDVYRRAADSDKENAKTHHSNAKARSERAASEQAAYEKSLAGKYDKMKADHERKTKMKRRKMIEDAFRGSDNKSAKRISVKDRHLVINGSRSGSRGLAVGETGEKPKSFKEKAYDALGGKYKTQAAEAHKDMVYYKNKADDISRRANAQGRAANANKKAGNVREYMANKEGARQLESEAKDNRLGQWDNAKKANSAQWKYDHSIAGLYDKATGKHKQVHKKTKVPNLMNQANYYYKETSNSKLFNHGKGKAKTSKEQAKAEVWTAADHQIKAKEYNDMSATQGHNESYYGQLYKNAAAKEARLAEGSYRRAAGLGKQASNETSTSSRPRARKKKHTSGGSGVTVRRPGRKPISRTKRVTQSSTGVKRRSATGTGARVR